MTNLKESVFEVVPYMVPVTIYGTFTMFGTVTMYGTTWPKGVPCMVPVPFIVLVSYIYGELLAYYMLSKQLRGVYRKTIKYRYRYTDNTDTIPIIPTTDIAQFRPQRTYICGLKGEGLYYKTIQSLFSVISSTFEVFFIILIFVQFFFLLNYRQKERKYT